MIQSAVRSPQSAGVRLVALVVGLLAFLFTAPAALAGDYAVGGGNNTNGWFQIGLSAHSGPSGEDPRGYVSARSRPNGDFPLPFRFGGEVTCLRVEGNQATIKYRFDHADNPLLVGGGIEIRAEDNGNPGDGPPVDRGAAGLPMTREVFEATQPEVCGDPRIGAYNDVDSGNVIVHDEVPD
jgi:hypothetical protein